MVKKILAVIVELIPIVSVPIWYILFRLSIEADWARPVMLICMALAFLGFGFFFLGRKIIKGDRTVLILGILDWLATASVIAFYVLAIMAFGQ